jgi:hypothetical protein
MEFVNAQKHFDDNDNAAIKDRNALKDKLSEMFFGRGTRCHAISLTELIEILNEIIETNQRLIIPPGAEDTLQKIVNNLQSAVRSVFDNARFYRILGEIKTTKSVDELDEISTDVLLEMSLRLIKKIGENNSKITELDNEINTTNQSTRLKLVNEKNRLIEENEIMSRRSLTLKKIESEGMESTEEGVETITEVSNELKDIHELKREEACNYIKEYYQFIDNHSRGGKRKRSKHNRKSKHSKTRYSKTRYSKKR